MKSSLLTNHVAWGAVGVLCAGVLLSEVNLLSARRFTRIDLSRDRSFTLNEASRSVLADLRTDTQVLVLLSSGDPRLSSVRQLLETYRAESALIRVRYIDPDRDLAEFLALTQKYDIGTDHVSETALVADAALLIRSGSRKWFIRSDRLRPSEAGLAPVLEAELTEALTRVRGRPEERICFVTGHGEASLDDGAREGLLELRNRLDKSNLRPERVPLDVPDPGRALEGCHAVVVVGPTRPFPKAHEEALLDAHERGAALLLFVDPIVNQEGRLAEVSLNRVAARLGVELMPGFVLEKDPAHRFPSALGEAFFPEVKSHPLTRGLSQPAARTDARVVLSASGPLTLRKGGGATALLTTTDKAEVLTDLGPESAADKTSESGAPLTLAAARVEDGSGVLARSLVVGCSNVLSNASFREPAYYGNRIFTENAFSWVLSRPVTASTTDRSVKHAGIGLDESALSGVLRYVLIYMPLFAASLGGIVLVRRSRKEALSRAKGEAES